MSQVHKCINCLQFRYSGKCNYASINSSHRSQYSWTPHMLSCRETDLWEGTQSNIQCLFIPFTFRGLPLNTPKQYISRLGSIKWITIGWIQCRNLMQIVWGEFNANSFPPSFLKLTNIWLWFPGYEKLLQPQWNQVKLMQEKWWTQSFHGESYSYLMT